MDKQIYLGFYNEDKVARTNMASIGETEKWGTVVFTCDVLIASKWLNNQTHRIFTFPQMEEVTAAKIELMFKDKETQNG